MKKLLVFLSSVLAVIWITNSSGQAEPIQTSLAEPGLGTTKKQWTDVTRAQALFSSRVQIMIDGRVVANVKNKQLAKQVIMTLKEQAESEWQRRKSEDRSSVRALSQTNSATAPSSTTVTTLSTSFVENVEFKEVLFDRTPVMEANDVVHLLQKKRNNQQLNIRTEEQKTHDQMINHQITYKPDSSLKKGQIRELVPGKNGLRRQVFKIDRLNGQEVKRKLISEQMLVAPVAAVKLRGTSEAKGASSGSFAMPVKRAMFTSPFGMRDGKMHKGIDLVSSDKNIYAADGGIVTFVGEQNGYGNIVIIRHANGYLTKYAHLESFQVTQGMRIDQGDVVGIMGNTGRSRGVHLHFEIVKHGIELDPYPYLYGK